MKRSQAIERIRARLLRRRMPRFQMAVIVAVTGLAGFLFSVLLLWGGVSHMALRYPLAATLAYVLFLGLLRLWMAAARTSTRPRLEVHPLDAAELVAELPTPRFRSPAPVEHLGPGDPGPDLPTEPPAPGIPAADSPGFDLDEGVVYVLPIILALAGIVATFSVIFYAPALFAELILDGIIVGSLYRRFRRLTPEGWLPVALRRTWIPFLAVVITLFAVGLCANQLAPGADSIGDLLNRRWSGR